MKSSKKILSLLIVMMMVVSLVPVGASATTTSTTLTTDYGVFTYDKKDPDDLLDGYTTYLKIVVDGTEKYSTTLYNVKAAANSAGFVCARGYEIKDTSVSGTGSSWSAVGNTAQKSGVLTLTKKEQTITIQLSSTVHDNILYIDRYVRINGSYINHECVDNVQFHSNTATNNNAVDVGYIVKNGKPVDESLMSLQYKGQWYDYVNCGVGADTNLCIHDVFYYGPYAKIEAVDTDGDGFVHVNRDQWQYTYVWQDPVASLFDINWTHKYGAVSVTADEGRINFTYTPHTKDSPADTHIKGDMKTENVTPATCTKAGSHDEVYYCTKCGKELARTTVTDPALGHLLEDVWTHDDTTEKENSTHYRQCQRTDPACDANPAPYTESEGCSFAVVSSTEADCLNGGSTTYKCSKCGYSYTVTTEPLDHLWDDGVTTPATCLVDGKIHYTCQRNSEHVKDETIPATGHKPGDVQEENVILPNCTEPGSHDEVTYCTNTGCGVELSRTNKEDAALWHKWSTNPYHDDTTEGGSSKHIYECIRYAHTIAGQAPVLYAMATVPAQSCNATMSEDCSFTETGRQEPTATVDGWIEYTCTKCLYSVKTPLTIDTYELTYNANGGDESSVPVDTGAYAADTNITLNSTAKPTHADVNGDKVVFIGWTASPDSKIYAKKETAPATITEVTMAAGGKTVYAVWGYDTNEDEIPDVLQTWYTVTYDGNASGCKSVPAAQTAAAGDDGKANLTLTSEKPIYDGYTFKGWSTTAKGKVEFNAGQKVTLTKDVTLYAVWEKATNPKTGDESNAALWIAIMAAAAVAAGGVWFFSRKKKAD